MIVLGSSKKGDKAVWSVKRVYTLGICLGALGF